MKIDLLACKNPSGSTFHFAKALHAAFVQEGITSRFFRIDRGNFYRVFYQISADPPDLICSFSEIRVGNRLLADLWQIPHLSILVDPAIYFLHHLKSPCTRVSCVDEEDVRFFKQSDARLFFLPHAGDPAHLTPVDAHRPHDRVFFGTCLDYDAIEKSWRDKYSPSICTVLHEASNRVLTSSETTILQALRFCVIDDKMAPLLHYEVDRYTKGKDRVALLRGKKVEIWGKGPWQKYCPDAIVHSPISFRHSLEIMKKSKIVFNSSPRFKYGAHERIFYGAICGAAVVTGENPFLKDRFSNKDLYFYKYGDWEITEEQKWKELAENCQQKILKEHLWSNRAKTMIALL